MSWSRIAAPKRRSDVSWDKISGHWHTACRLIPKASPTARSVPPKSRMASCLVRMVSMQISTERLPKKVKHPEYGVQ